jgi:hypothetical protein
MSCGVPVLTVCTGRSPRRSAGRSPKNRRHPAGLVGAQEARPALLHGDAVRRGAGAGDVDPDRSLRELDGDVPARRRQVEASRLEQGMGERDRGMAGQRYLAVRGEVAGPHVGATGGAAGRAQGEGGLGQVHLAGDRLHGGLVERIGVEHHGAGVAGEAMAGERIHLKTRQSPHRRTIAFP